LPVSLSSKKVSGRKLKYNGQHFQKKGGLSSVGALLFF
jgi:hypothetical protein